MISPWVPQLYVLNHPVCLSITHTVNIYTFTVRSGNRLVPYAWRTGERYRGTRKWYSYVSAMNLRSAVHLMSSFRICWPIDGDQPVLSVQAAYTLRVAFELVEVRTGHGLKPLHRLRGRKPEGTRVAVGREMCEVIDATRAEAGQELRKNAEIVKAEMQKSWDKGGSAKKELRLLLEKATVV